MKLKVFRRTTEDRDRYVCVNVGRRRRYEVSIVHVDVNTYNVVVDVSAYNYHLMPSEAGAFAKSSSRRYLKINKSFTKLTSEDIELIRTHCPGVLLDTVFGYWVTWLYRANPRIKSDKYRRLIVNSKSDEVQKAIREVDEFMHISKNADK